MGTKIVSESNNTMTIILGDKKLTFKFRSLNNTLEKCFTICTIETSIYMGVLHVSDFRSGDLEAYNKDFVNIIKERVEQIDSLGSEYFFDIDDYAQHKENSRDVKLEKRQRSKRKVNVTNFTPMSLTTT